MNTTRSIDNKLEKWLIVERGKQESTKEDYRRDFTRFFDWLAKDGEQVETVQQSDITAYVAHLKDSDLAPASVARSTVAVRSSGSWLLKS